MIKKIYKVKDKPLRGLTSKEIPSYFLIFDTETYPKIEGKIETHVFRIGWTCFWNRKAFNDKDGYEWKYWKDAKAMCKYIHDRATNCGKLVLVAHNIFFDLQVSGFFDYFTRMKWKADFIYDRQKTFILKCRLYKSTLICLSTTNWFDQKLEELGEIVGLKKLKVDFDNVTPQALRVYCRRDVEILVRMMKYYIDFIKEHQLGKFSWSKSSQAFNAYRYRFMQHKIRIHSNNEVVELERAAYMGGRCECFQVGKVEGDKFLTLDVNSMYPYVMKDYEYPYQLVDYIKNPARDKIKEALKRYAVIAEVEMATNENAFPVIHDNKTVFPVGCFTCYLCSEGLKYALANKYIKKIKRCSLYSKGNLFISYVNYFYPLRLRYAKEKNKIMETFCKYLLNSLYGKWGQKYQLEERIDCEGIHDYFRDEILDMRTGKLITHTWLMNQEITRYDEIEGKNSMVAIVAHVTENARLLLWKIINETGKDKVLYCDTDSIKIRGTDLKNVKHKMHRNKLGCLKVEEECSELFIGGNKYYITEKNRKIKGIPQNAVEIEPGVFEFYSWPKMTYHLRNGIIKGYHRKKISRRVSLNYDKGIVKENGKVDPFTFPISL